MDKEEIILHLLWGSKLSSGGHYFYLEIKERGPIFSFYSCGWLARSTVLHEPVFSNLPGTDFPKAGASSNTGKKEENTSLFLDCIWIL